jgi:hypothetical protein
MWSNPAWGGDEFMMSDLKRSLGDSLLDFLSRNIPEASAITLLTKTPDVRNLFRHFEYFPESKVIIIVRNPFDIAMSAFKTWKRPMADTSAKWNRSFSEIHGFEKSVSPNQYYLVRYEDLVQDSLKIINQCLYFIGLDPLKYDYSSLTNLPVYGSSEKPRWQVSSADNQFKPVGRGKNLTDSQLKSLQSLNTHSLDYFGYPDNPDLDNRNLPDRQYRLKFNPSSLEAVRGNTMSTRHMQSFSTLFRRFRKLRSK